MRIELPDINWGDDVGELFDKITVVTLKDLRNTLDADVKRLASVRKRNGKLNPAEEEDYVENSLMKDKLDHVIKYFGG